MLVAVVIGAVVIVVVILVVAIGRRRADPVDSFRRQIDALSPEARRPIISQAKPPDETPDVPPGDVTGGGVSGAGDTAPPGDESDSGDDEAGDGVGP